MKLDISLGDIAEALSGTEGVKGRAEVVPTGRDFTILIQSSVLTFLSFHLLMLSDFLKPKQV